MIKYETLVKAIDQAIDKWSKQVNEIDDLILKTPEGSDEKNILRIEVNNANVVLDHLYDAKIACEFFMEVQ